MGTTRIFGKLSLWTNLHGSIGFHGFALKQLSKEGSFTTVAGSAQQDSYHRIMQLIKQNSVSVESTIFLVNMWSGGGSGTSNTKKKQKNYFMVKNCNINLKSRIQTPDPHSKFISKGFYSDPNTHFSEKVSKCIFKYS